MNHEIPHEFESDKNSNTLHPRRTQKLIGHNYAKKLFMESYKSGKTHHAWLINGPKGVGKATLSWQITKFLLNDYSSIDFNDKIKKSIISRRIEALSEPSLFLCRKQFDKSKNRFHQEISVDEIRKINHFFSLTNSESKWRIVIIDTVDDLSNSAANALLKILEEPPIGGIFFLICENKEKILPTILSRCRLLKCSFLEWDEFKEILSGLKIIKIKEKDMMKLFSLTKGSISKAIDIAVNDGFGILKQIFEILNFKNQIDRSKIWDLLNQNSSSSTSKERYLFIKELLLFSLSTISSSSAKTNVEFYSTEEKEIVEYYYTTGSYFPFAWIHSLLINDFKQADVINLDPIDTLLIAFFKIEKILLRFRELTQKNLT